MVDRKQKKSDYEVWTLGLGEHAKSVWILRQLIPIEREVADSDESLLSEVKLCKILTLLILKIHTSMS